MAGFLKSGLRMLDRFQRLVTPTLNQNFKDIEDAFGVAVAKIEEVKVIADSAASKTELEKVAGTVPTAAQIGAQIDEQVADIANRVGSLESWQEEGVEASKVLGQIVASQIDVPALDEQGQLGEGVVDWSKLDAQTQSAITESTTQAGQALSLVRDETSTRIAEAAAAAQRTTTLEAVVSGNQATTDARLNTLATADLSASQRLDTLTATVADNQATVTSRLNTLTTADQAASQRMDTLTATVSDNKAAADVRFNALASTDSAISQRVDTLTATVSNNDATASSAIASANQSRASGDAANAAAINTLTATVNANQSSTTTAINAVNAKADQAQATADGKASAASVASLAAQVTKNLLDAHIWQDGVMPPGAAWSMNGSSSENAMTMASGPYGDNCTVWYAKGTAGDADGGWNHDPITLDGTKMHRFTVWVKRISGGALVYLGTNNVKNIPGELNGNPYFVVCSSGLLIGRWYLLVGYVMQTGFGGGQENRSGVYDGVTGEKIYSGTDYQFVASSNPCTHRAYQFYGTEGCEQFFALPRIDVCDGNEPSLTELLSGAIKTSLAATLSRVAQVETTVATKASASEVVTLTATVANQSASITSISSALVTVQGQVNAKVGAILEVNGKLSGFQSSNDGVRSDFIITADKVTISASNLFPDPNFKDPSSWRDCLRDAGYQGVSGWPTAGDSRVALFGRRDCQSDLQIPVVEGESFRFRFCTMNGSQTSSTRGMIVFFMNASSGILSYQILAGKAPSTGWQAHSGSFTVPSGSTYIQIGPWIEQDHSSLLTVYYAACSLSRMTDGNLLVQGTVTAQHLNTASLKTLDANIGYIHSDDGLAFMNLNAAAAQRFIQCADAFWVARDGTGYISRSFVSDPVAIWSSSITLTLADYSVVGDVVEGVFRALYAHPTRLSEKTALNLFRAAGDAKNHRVVFGTPTDVTVTDGAGRLINIYVCDFAPRAVRSSSGALVAYEDYDRLDVYFRMRVPSAAAVTSITLPFTIYRV